MTVLLLARLANELLEPQLAAEAHLLRQQKLTLAQIGGHIHRSESVVRRLMAEYPARAETLEDRLL